MRCTLCNFENLARIGEVWGLIPTLLRALAVERAAWHSQGGAVTGADIDCGDIDGCDSESSENSSKNRQEAHMPQIASFSIAMAVFAVFVVTGMQIG